MNTRAVVMLALLVWVFDSPALAEADVLDDLRDGNGRFVAGIGARRASPEQLKAKIAPRAVVLACSDARIPVLHALDQPAGEVWTVRTPGLRLDAETVASLEVALAGGTVQAVVVLGHGDGESAVAATHGVLARLLRASEVLRRRVAARRLELVGGAYALATGRITWLGAHPKQERLLEVVQGTTPPPHSPVCCSISAPRGSEERVRPAREWLEAGWSRFERRSGGARWTRRSRRVAARVHRPRVVLVTCSELSLSGEDLFDAELGTIETVRLAAGLPSGVQRLALARLCRGEVGALVVIGHTGCEVAAQAQRGSSDAAVGGPFAEHVLKLLGEGAPQASTAKRIVAGVVRELRSSSTPEFEGRLRSGAFPLLAGVLSASGPTIQWLEVPAGGGAVREHPSAAQAAAPEARPTVEEAVGRVAEKLEVFRVRWVELTGLGIGLALLLFVLRRFRPTAAPAPPAPVVADDSTPAPEEAPAAVERQREARPTVAVRQPPPPPPPPSGQSDDQLWATLISLETGGEEDDSMWETLISADPLAEEVAAAAGVPPEEEETNRIAVQDVTAPESVEPVVEEGAAPEEPEPEPEAKPAPPAPERAAAALEEDEELEGLDGQENEEDEEDEEDEESAVESEEEAMMRIWLEETGEPAM